MLLALGGEAVPIRVNYDAPYECPSAAAFYDAINARTDHVRPAVGEEPRLDVTVRVTRDSRGFVGDVREVVNGKESAIRSVNGETCKDVIEALSLTVALSIDPDAHAPQPKPASAASTQSAARDEPGPRAARESRGSSTPGESGEAGEPREGNAPNEPSSSSAAPLHLEIGFGAFGTVVDTAGFNLGGALSATLLRDLSPSTSSSAQLALVFASTGFPSSPSDHRARFGALSLDACPWRQRFVDVELAPCALAEFGVLEVTGRDLVDAKTVDRAWWSAGLDAQLSWLLGHGWVFEGAIGGTVPLVRRRYFTSHSDHVVAETPALAPLARLGLGFRF